MTPPASRASFEQIRKHVLDDGVELLGLTGLAVPTKLHLSRDDAVAAVVIVALRRVVAFAGAARATMMAATIAARKKFIASTFPK